MTRLLLTLLTVPKAWRIAPVALALVLGACSSLPNANERRVPDVAAVADASPERLALNAQVYDLVVNEVAERHYQREEVAPHWREQAAEKRAEVIAGVDEAGFYTGLNAVLADLGDKHTSATRPPVKPSDPAATAGGRSRLRFFVGRGGRRRGLRR